MFMYILMTVHKTVIKSVPEIPLSMSNKENLIDL
jgi:hypothetical protein